MQNYLIKQPVLELLLATFLVYFFYTKYFSVLSSFQLTIMVFQAAHLTLILKQVKEQRITNKALREKGEFWIGNFFTVFFFFFSLVTISMMFARTVALQARGPLQGWRGLLMRTETARPGSTRETMGFFSNTY